MNQSELGQAVGYSQSAISRLENGIGRIDHALLVTVTRYLGIRPVDLGLTANVFPAVETPPNLAAEPEVDMKRLEFIRGALGSAAALLFPSALTEESSRVTPQDVAEYDQVIQRLDSVDNRLGGGHVRELSALLVRRIERLLRRGTYSRDVGRGLREVLATGHETAGWFAFDAGDAAEARHHWLECLHSADVGGFGVQRTTVMAHMALHAIQDRHGAEAVELAQAAVRDPATPARVRSLLAAREALGYAVQGDRVASDRSFARSAQLLDRGPSPDDPQWVDFWGPADLACHRSRAGLLLGDLRQAERAGRGAAATRSDGFTRNQALYRVRLAHILARRRSYDEAIALARPVAAAPRIYSGRVASELRRTVSLISTTDYRPAQEFVTWARRVGVA